MCTETGIKDVYRGVQGACPWRAVTHAGGTAERSERRAVGMGLKLVEPFPRETDIEKKGGWRFPAVLIHKQDKEAERHNIDIFRHSR